MIKALGSLCIILILSGCFFYPLQTAQPLKIRVVDAATGRAIQGATVLRIVCDVHDYTCDKAFIDKNKTDGNGFLELDGNREFGLWFPAPGGLPVPNHQIAVWKDGYSAFIFSQYEHDIEEFSKSIKNTSIIDELSQIPEERVYPTEGFDPSLGFNNGVIELKAIDDQ